MQILQAVEQIREEHDRERDRAPEVAPRERNAGDREEQAVEEVPLVHASRQHEEGQRRDRAAFEQRALRAVLQIAPDDQREGSHDQQHDPRRIAASPKILWAVRHPERAAKRPEIERVDAVVRIDVRADSVAFEEPAEGRDRIARMERLASAPARATVPRAMPCSRGDKSLAPALRIDERESDEQRQQHRGLRLDQQRVPNASHAPTIHPTRLCRGRACRERSRRSRSSA